MRHGARRACHDAARSHESLRPTKHVLWTHTPVHRVGAWHNKSRYPFLHYRRCAKGRGLSINGARRDRGHRGGPRGGASPTLRQQKAQAQQVERRRRKTKTTIHPCIHVSNIVQHPCACPIVPCVSVASVPCQSCPLSWEGTHQQHGPVLLHAVEKPEPHRAAQQSRRVAVQSRGAMRVEPKHRLVPTAASHRVRRWRRTAAPRRHVDARPTRAAGRARDAPSPPVDERGAR